jgi:activator of 2-hydroxyglutaryl-CoA dehydratase
VHLAIAKRTISLARRIPIEPAITMTGGVSRNVGMVKALEQVLETTLQVGPDAHYTGAIGAALFALEKLGGHGVETDVKGATNATRSGD